MADPAPPPPLGTLLLQLRADAVELHDAQIFVETTRAIGRVLANITIASFEPDPPTKPKKEI